MTRSRRRIAPGRTVSPGLPSPASLSTSSAPAGVSSFAPARWLLAAGLSVLTLVAFAEVRHFDFVSMDDYIYVTSNAHVLSGLSWSGIGWAFTTSDANFWHPLTWLSLMLDVQMFGVNPGALHVTNLLFHLASTLILFVALSRMTGRVGRSAFVAALFAVHPLHVESVAWISERKDVLSTLFMMLTLWGYAVYADKRRLGRPATAAFLGVFVMFALGLMAKPMLVTLPFVLLLLDWWPLRRAAFWSGAPDGRPSLASVWRSWSPLVREKLPLFALAAVSGVVALFAQEQGGALAGLGSFPLAGRLANALHSYVAYVGQMFWPVGLVAFYPYPQAVAIWPAVAALVALVAVTAAVAYVARRRPYLAVGWIWYVGTLLPVSGLVQVGSHAMADRYTYVPLIGLFVMVAWGAAEAAGRARLHRGVAGAVACAVLVACAVTTRAQVETWKDSMALWQHAVAVMPTNYYAHNALGLELSKQGRTSEAKEHFIEASRLAPGFANSHSNLGLVLEAEGLEDEAMSEYRKAVDLDPKYPQARINLGNALLKTGRAGEATAQYTEAVRLAPDSAAARTDLGTALLEAKRSDEAIVQFRQAVRLHPEYALAHYNLANALRRIGRPEEAAGQYRDALRLQSPADSVETRNNLGATLLQMGRVNEAAAEFDQVLRLKPGFSPALNNLGNLLLQTGHPAEAAERYREAIRQAPTDSEAHMNLGNALADLGQLDDAEREQRQAIRLDPNSANAHYNLGNTLTARGRLEEALAHYAEALRLEGPSADVNCALGITLERLGRTGDAIVRYREALRLQPNHADAAAGLARISSKRGTHQQP
jgi:tetratricopeptide (TPR) repeat protein